MNLNIKLDQQKAPNEVINHQFVKPVVIKSRLLSGFSGHDRFLNDFLDKTENPKSDAKVSFTPMASHCKEWNDRAVLTLIGERVKH